jgi:hypothetical protein
MNEQSGILGDVAAASVPGKRTPGPVFVVGMNGSGSTMLADSLDRHPELYFFVNESLVLPWFIRNAARYGDLEHDSSARRRLADALGSARSYWQFNGKAPVIVPDSALTEPGFAAVADAIYRHFAAKFGKTRWGDKSPMYLQHIDLLARTFPTAQFVHIYRDGRDAAQSFHRRWGYNPLRTIYRWKKVIELGRQQGRELGPERYMEVSYEALTTDPEQWMRKICAFLAMPFDPAVLGSSMRFVEGVKPAEGRMVANSGKWRSYFSAGQVDAMERISGAMLVELGYESRRPDGNAEPSQWQQKLWLIHDRGTRILWSFREYGFRVWPFLLRSAKDALRQSSANRY